MDPLSNLQRDIRVIVPALGLVRFQTAVFNGEKYNLKQIWTVTQDDDFSF